MTIRPKYVIKLFICIVKHVAFQRQITRNATSPDVRFLTKLMKDFWFKGVYSPAVGSFSKIFRQMCSSLVNLQLVISKAALLIHDPLTQLQFQYSIARRFVSVLRASNSTYFLPV